jgi:hypothetical protein
MDNTCYNCGRNYIVKGGLTVCPACGYIKPKEELVGQELIDYDAAHKALRNARFDEAEESFLYYTKRYPKNSDGYWFLVLSRYGIKYDGDESSKEPTCFTQYSSILTDEDFIKACRLADNEKKEYYLAQATKIDAIREKWCKLAQSEKPYDVFICYKEAVDGERTVDSTDALEIYSRLRDSGYYVFFSRETMRGKVAEDYEPYIYNALSTAKAMVVYGSDPDYFESPWMKNEWLRFSKQIELGQKEPNSIIPVYKNFNPNRLPPKLKNMQALDASANTFFFDLNEHIKKLVYKKKESASTRPNPTESAANEAKTASSKPQNGTFKKAMSGLQTVVSDKVVPAVTTAVSAVGNAVAKIPMSLEESRRKKEEERVAKELERKRKEELKRKKRFKKRLVWLCILLAGIGTALAVSQIQKYGFNNYQLTYEAVEGGYEVIGAASGDGGRLVIPSTYNGGDVVGISEAAFEMDSTIKSVKIGKNLKYISNRAFESCDELKKVEFAFDASLAKIGANTFRGCTKLEKIKLPDGVDTIGAYAFFDCMSLTSISIPLNVTTLNAHTFNGCTNLETVTLGANLEYVGDRAFYGCDSLSEIIINSYDLEVASTSYMFSTDATFYVQKDSLYNETLSGKGYQSQNTDKSGYRKYQK